jgi:hypothetical protein
MLVALALVLALGTVTAAAAQTSGPGAAAAKTADAKKNVSRNVSGTVKSSSADTVVVAGRDRGKDAEWTFAIEPTTDIRKGGKSVVANSLKPGDNVHVRFTEREGKAMARSIVVKGKETTTKKTKS